MYILLKSGVRAWTQVAGVAISLISLVKVRKLSFGGGGAGGGWLSPKLKSQINSSAGYQ